MAVRIKVAQSSWELDELYKLRHKVFVEQGKYLPPRDDKRLFDRFDSFPTTTNIIGISDGYVIAGVRLSESSPVGLPTDDFFDFSPFLPKDNAKTGSGSMLCVEQAYRHQKRFTSSMMGMFYYLARLRGLTHIVGVVNPKTAEAFVETGYELVAPKCFHKSHGLEGRPIILDLEKLTDKFIHFVQRQNIEHFLANFDREFYSAGETIIQKDTHGDVVYVVVDGRVSMHQKAPGVSSVELDVGSLFGELALITGWPRAFDVIAKTDVDLMVIDRTRLFEKLREDPENGVKLLQIVSHSAYETLRASPEA